MANWSNANFWIFRVRSSAKEHKIIVVQDIKEKNKTGREKEKKGDNRKYQNWNIFFKEALKIK